MRGVPDLDPLRAQRLEALLVDRKQVLDVQRASTWYQPQISGSSTTYIVVNAPR